MFFCHEHCLPRATLQSQALAEKDPCIIGQALGHATGFLFWGNVAKMAGAASLDLGVQIDAKCLRTRLAATRFSAKIYRIFFSSPVIFAFASADGADGVAFDELRICKNI